MHEALVIDIGGTKTNLSVVTEENKGLKVIENKTFQTLLNPEHEIQKIYDHFSSFKHKPEILSLSLPGRWNSNGILEESLFLKDWEGYAFVKNLAEELKIKNYVHETDVICGALGEWHVGALHATPLLYINMGTGIGAAFIDGGKPFKTRAHHGVPLLRMQKMVLPFQDELYSAVDLISGGMLTENSGYNSAEALFSAYKNADIEAIDIISNAQTQLAAWLINLFYLFGPDIIVLNGGLTYDWEILCEGAVEIAKEELENDVQIIPSKLKELAPVYGAYVKLYPPVLN